MPFFGFGRSKEVAKRPARHVQRLSQVENNIVHDKNVMKDAQRETYQYDQPNQDLGITDLIKDHKSGERFLYAAVTASQDEEESSRLRRLIQFQPRLKRKPIPISDLPCLELYKEVETFKLSDLLPPVRKGEKKTYINVSEVVVVYGSLISSDAQFSKVKVSIVDDRLLQNKVAKSYIANTNVISKATMSLCYCFPKDEVDAISLSISREAAFLEEGRQWGVVQIQLQMTETEFPVQLSNSAVRAINTLPQSMLETADVNPNMIDISIMNNDRKQLQDMYMEGDLADETAPVVNKTEVVKYAKSSMAGPKGKKTSAPAGEGWDFMAGKRTNGVNAGDNSVEPSDDGSDDGIPMGMSPPASHSPTVAGTPPLKSAMKKRVSIADDVDEEVPRRPSTPPENRSLQVLNPLDNL